MDASKIIVLVLTLATVALLAWVELKSRRNSRAVEKATTQASSKDQPPAA